MVFFTSDQRGLAILLTPPRPDFHRGAPAAGIRHTERRSNRCPQGVSRQGAAGFPAFRLARDHAPSQGRHNSRRRVRDATGTERHGALRCQSKLPDERAYPGTTSRAAHLDIGC